MVKKIFIKKSLDDAISKCGYTLHDLFTDFNPKDFRKERYSRKDGQIRSANPSPVGPLQQLQEDLQDKIDYTNEEKSILDLYTCSSFWDYTAYFYHKGELEDIYGTGWKYNVYSWHWEGSWKEGNLERVFDKPQRFKEYSVWDFEGLKVPQDKLPPGEDGVNPKRIGKVNFKESIDILDNMIDKSPPLQENTVLYRYGTFDPNLMPGETGKWKSYTSTSFNSYIYTGIKKYTGFNPGDDDWKIKIYAPKGTKGVVPCPNTGCTDWQSEFTLGRNQKYMVISRDPFKRTAEILLY